MMLWALAGECLFCGVVFWFIVRGFAQMFAGISVQLRPLTRILLWVGPFGWFGVFLACSFLIALQGIKLPRPTLRRTIAIALCLALGMVMVGFISVIATICLQPVCEFQSNIASEKG